MLDFPTTVVGRTVPQEKQEEEAGSEVSEWERREREEQLARMVEEEGRLGDRRGHMPRLGLVSLSRQGSGSEPLAAFPR